MKKIFLLCALILSSFSPQVMAQQTLINPVIQKFKNDNQSFEEFVLLGKMYCYTEHLEKNSGIYFYTYASLYNSLKPFTRLIEKDAIEQSIGTYIKNKKTVFSQNQDKELSLYTKMKQCDDLFKKEKLRVDYVQLVTNPNKHLRSSDDDPSSFTFEEIEGFRRNYLDGYLIQINTK